MIIDLPTKRRPMRYHSGKHFSEFYVYKMAAKINWHKYGTKSRHYRPR